MRHVLEATAAAAILVAGAIGPSFADEQEVHDISWNLETNYNGGGQTVCVAENYNEYPVMAQFSVFPADFDEDGNPLPDRAVVTLRPYAETPVYSWQAGYTGPGPNCSLLNYSVSAR
jgi:hypothetical protein